MKRGDVVLVQIPFVGSPGAKVRPAVVVQSDSLHGLIRETIIAAITTNLFSAHQPHQLLIDISTADGAAWAAHEFRGSLRTAPHRSAN